MNEALAEYLAELAVNIEGCAQETDDEHERAILERLAAHVSELSEKVTEHGAQAVSEE